MLCHGRQLTQLAKWCSNFHCLKRRTIKGAIPATLSNGSAKQLTRGAQLDLDVGTELTAGTGGDHPGLLHSTPNQVNKAVSRFLGLLGISHRLGFSFNGPVQALGCRFGGTSRLLFAATLFFRFALALFFRFALALFFRFTLALFFRLALALFFGLALALFFRLALALFFGLALALFFRFTLALFLRFALALFFRFALALFFRFALALFFRFALALFFRFALALFFRFALALFFRFTLALFFRLALALLFRLALALLFGLLLLAGLFLGATLSLGLALRFLLFALLSQSLCLFGAPLRIRLGSLPLFLALPLLRLTCRLLFCLGSLTLGFRTRLLFFSLLGLAGFLFRLTCRSACPGLLGTLCLIRRRLGTDQCCLYNRRGFRLIGLA